METEIFLVRVEDEPDPGLILNSESFRHSLLVMERTVLANVYQPRLAAYRQLPALVPALELNDEPGKHGPPLQQHVHTILDTS